MRWSSISSAASTRRATIPARRWPRATPRHWCRTPCRSDPASLRRASAWCSRSRRLGSVLRVPGFAREHAQIDADLLQCPLVFAVGVLAENQLGIGRAVQPAVMLDLVLELAGRPPGIAEREDRALRSLSARDRLEDVERRRETDALVDRHRRVLDEKIA